MLQGKPRSTSGTSSIAMATRFLSGFAIKISEKVKMTLQEQENERNCETLDLHTMYDGFDTEKLGTTSDKCY